MSYNSHLTGHLNRYALADNFRDFCSHVDELVESGKVCFYGDKWNIVVSGSAMPIYFDVSKRAVTDDIDIVRSYVGDGIVGLYHDYDMNTGPSAFLGTMPYNYEDRLAKVYESDYMIIYRPSWNDLAFSKLQRYEIQDILDLEGMVEHELIDWDFLDYLMRDKLEALGSGMTDRTYDQTMFNYEDFVAKYRK